MKKVLLLGMLSLCLMACERHDTSKTTNGRVGENYERDNTGRYERDNTGRNVRDRESGSLTAGSQSESEADRTMTQKIRQALMDDDSLSTNAKNIKVITINGIVTLKGPVANAREKEIILMKVREIQGIKRVENQLEEK